MRFRALRFILRLFRELADESAYQRYLAFHNLGNSVEEWRKFHDEQLERKFSLPRCC
jgi:hypothetical protein